MSSSGIKASCNLGKCFLSQLSTVTEGFLPSLKNQGISTKLILSNKADAPLR
jgi:hypothetical protein